MGFKKGSPVSLSGWRGFFASWPHLSRSQQRSLHPVNDTVMIALVAIGVHPFKHLLNSAHHRGVCYIGPITPRMPPPASLQHHFPSARAGAQKLRIVERGISTSHTPALLRGNGLCSGVCRLFGMSTANRTLTPVYRHLCAFHHFRFACGLIRIARVA